MAKKDKKKKKKKGGLIIKTRRKGSFRIPEAMYKAKVLSVDVDDGQYGEQIVWNFKVIKGKQKGKELKLWSNVIANPKNKTGKILKALGKRKIRDGDIDLEKFVGKKCRVIVEDHETKSGDETSKITQVLPYDLEED